MDKATALRTLQERMEANRLKADQYKQDDLQGLVQYHCGRIQSYREAIYLVGLIVEIESQ